MKIRDDVFFAAWKKTFHLQLEAQFIRIGKAVLPSGQDDDGTHLKPYTGDFGDFCLLVFTLCPELIDNTQN